VIDILPLDFSHLPDVNIVWNSLPDSNDERYLDEDLVYITVGDRYAVDAGWYHGKFGVWVVRDNDWENLVECVELEDVHEVQAEIIRLVVEYSSRSINGNN
jgi:hypothetical protein